MRLWHKHRVAKNAWLYGDLKYRRARLLAAMESGELVPKDPREVKATPPRLIVRGNAPKPPGGVEPARIALIRERVEARRHG